MVAIIVGTHGRFSEELLKSSEMIFGSQENISSITFEPGESADGLVEKYEQQLKKLDTKDGVLILVDLFGGSPFNAASRVAIENENMDIVTGVNLPMLLEVFGSRGFSKVEELVNVAKTSGNQSIKSFRETLNKADEEDDL
ncbi:PTS sugar transporter subunit IIA [Haloimpatiens sp. FM7330]|uniref:PTS sugar transporter subunit IIA n=1 Tax=Haloimpatiens sp. FM7330 TaxID=3298610 RepID=UPI003625DA1F